MKVLVLTSTYSRWAGDTEPRFVDNLSQTLGGEHTVHVLAPHAPGARMDEMLEGIQVFRFRYWPGRFASLTYGGGILPNLRENPLRLFQVPFFLAAQWLAIVQLCRRHDYDLIHAHWIIPQGVSAVLARPLTRGRIPLVLTSHGGDLFALRGRLLSALKRRVTRACDALTVVSEAMRSRAATLGLKPAEHIHSIPMGVDTGDTFRPPEGEADRRGMLFVGRLVEKKGVEYLLRALPGVVDAFPDSHLTVVGDGPLRAELEALCGTLGIADNVTFAGGVANSEVPAYLRSAAIAVFPSIVTDSGDQEGTPVAIMEALACGCAAVVSEYPGASDIISDGVNGLLVPQRAPEELCTAVASLLADPTLRARLGSEGRALVCREYDWAVIGGRFSAVFAQVAGNGSQGGPAREN